MDKCEITFSRSSPWECPACGPYYIQDRAAGKNIYSHDAYEYALYRKEIFRPEGTFRTKKQAYRYVCSKTGLSPWDVKYKSTNILIDREKTVVFHDGTYWQIAKRTRPVRVLSKPEDKRLSAWYLTYAECLSDAKEIIAEEEKKCLSGQKKDEERRLTSMQ